MNTIDIPQVLDPEVLGVHTCTSFKNRGRPACGDTWYVHFHGCS